MGVEQLEEFMSHLAELESGNNYSAVGPNTWLGNGLGKYQIMSKNWPLWAKQAGIPGADWRDPAAQDKVAAFKFQEYYNKFGSWDLVAVAWFAGPGAAEQAASSGLDSVGNRKDVLGTTVKKYVQATAGRLTPTPKMEVAPSRRVQNASSRELLSAVFASMSNAIAGGQRQLPPLHRATPRPVEDTPAELQSAPMTNIVEDNSTNPEEVI